MRIIDTDVLRVLKKVNSDLVTVGAAFLVSDFLVITCAHVIEAAGATIGEKIPLKSTTGTIIEAFIEPKFWSDPNIKDISILRLDRPFKDMQPIALGSSIAAHGHNFSTYGFPKPDEEYTGRGIITGNARIYGIKFLQLGGSEVEPGFSGAPVFDEITKRVVGMVVSIKPPNEYLQQGTKALAISSETIRDFCPDLKISDTCPYLGLNAFKEDDEAYFFGRERVIEKMVGSLKRDIHLLAVLGPSGSGKSSAVRAGLIPALKRGVIPSSEKWGVIVIRTTDNPYDQLNRAGLGDTSNGIFSAVSSWLSNNPENTRLVLVLDQFEEILYSIENDKSKKFIKELGALLHKSSTQYLPVTLVLVLRDAFVSHFIHIADSLIGWFEHCQVIIPSTIERFELHEMISKPAKSAGLSFEEGLVDNIIQEAINSGHEVNIAQSTILPLLEFTLAQLWQRRSDGQLTNSAYRTIGGVAGGLTQWANKTYSEIEALNRGQLCKRILCDLVRLGNLDSEMPDTRKRVSILDLTLNPSELKDVQQVVSKLANARLLTFERDYKQREVVELIHDTMLTEWQDLQNWIHEHRSFLVWKQKTTERLNDWKNDRGDLLYGRDLEIAKDYTETYKDRVNNDLISFIDKSNYTYQDTIWKQKRNTTLLKDNYGVLSGVKEIVETVGLGLDLKKTLEAIMEILHMIFENTRLCVLLYQHDNHTLSFAPSALKYYKIQSKEYRKQITFPLEGKSIACRVARKALKSKLLVCENVENVHADPDYVPLSRTIQSELCVSLISTKSELLGVLVLERNEPNAFKEADEDFAKTVAQQLSVAIERAQQSEELAFRSTVAAQTAWAADIAHDIIIEVGQIRDWAYMLREQLKEDPILREYAKKIEESASVLSSAGPWNDQPPQVIRLDLFLERHLTSLVSRQNLTPNFSFTASDAYILVNPSTLQHVLRQLVRNSARAMSNSTVRKLTVSTHLLANSTVEILFQDSGPGISEEIRQSLFQRPITTKGRGGYGLLLVRQMVEDMHGRISLLPQKKGRGATFSIRFPVISTMSGDTE